MPEKEYDLEMDIVHTELIVLRVQSYKIFLYNLIKSFIL